MINFKIFYKNKIQKFNKKNKFEINILMNYKINQLINQKKFKIKL